MTDKPYPTDAEIVELMGDPRFSTITAVREAIAKWGTPAGAEPLANLVRAAQAFVLDPTSLQKKLHLEAQAWGPLAATPQPQAGADALESQAREIARIEAENDLLRQHAAKQISDATLLTGIDCGNESMNMGLQGGAAQLLAESFFDQFQSSEAVNYLELRFGSEKKMPGKSMVVTLQLVGGITPGQRIADQAREIEARERLFWEACQPHSKAGEVVYMTYKTKRDAAMAQKGASNG